MKLQGFLDDAHGVGKGWLGFASLGPAYERVIFAYNGVNYAVIAKILLRGDDAIGARRLLYEGGGIKGLGSFGCEGMVVSGGMKIRWS